MFGVLEDSLSRPSIIFLTLLFTSTTWSLGSNNLKNLVYSTIKLSGLPAFNLVLYKGPNVSRKATRNAPLFCTCGTAPSVATASIFSDKISFTAFLAASVDKPSSKENNFFVKSLNSLLKSLSSITYLFTKLKFDCSKIFAGLSLLAYKKSAKLSPSLTFLIFLPSLIIISLLFKASATVVLLKFFLTNPFKNPIPAAASSDKANILDAALAPLTALPATKVGSASCKPKSKIPVAKSYALSSGPIKNSKGLNSTRPGVTCGLLPLAISAAALSPSNTTFFSAS